MPVGSNGRHWPSGCARRSATTQSTNGLKPSPRWLPATRTFSCSAGSPSMVASCGGTTPSVSEYRHEIGTGSAFGPRRFFARRCVTCAAVPIGCAISR